MSARGSEEPSMNTTDRTSETIAVLPSPSISQDTKTANNDHAWTLIERKKRLTVIANQAIASSADVYMAEDHTIENNVSTPALVSRHTNPDERASLSFSQQ